MHFKWCLIQDMVARIGFALQAHALILNSYMCKVRVALHNKRIYILEKMWNGDHEERTFTYTIGAEDTYSPELCAHWYILVYMYIVRLLTESTHTSTP